MEMVESSARNHGIRNGWMVLDVLSDLITQYLITLHRGPSTKSSQSSTDKIKGER